MTESELVSKALAGDEACKERLVKQYRLLILKMASPFFGRLEDTESLAFLAFWEALPRFDPSKAMLSTYVGTVVKNKLWEALRAARPYSRSGKPKIFEESLNEFGDYPAVYPETDGEIAAQQTEQAIREVLSPREQALLSALIEGGRSSHWAKEVGCSESRAHQLKNSIRDKARELLAA